MNRKSNNPIKGYFTSNENIISYPSVLNITAEIFNGISYPHTPAIHFENGSLTYQQLLEKVNQVANYLSNNYKVTPGTRILLNGFNSRYLAISWLAVLKLGCIAVTTVSLLKERELDSVLELSDAELIIFDANNKEEILKVAEKHNILDKTIFFNSGENNSLEYLIEDEAVSFDPIKTFADDIAIIAFTSGSTGIPKGTLHTHRDLMYICDCFPKDILKIRSTDIICGTPPLAFTYGLGGMLLFPLRYGASVVLIDKLSPEKLLVAIEKYQVTICFSSPTAYKLMLSLLLRYSIKSLKKCVSAGEHLPTHTFEQWKKLTGISIIDGIGSTEMLHIFISTEAQYIKPGATGKPIPGYLAKIVDEEGNELAPNKIGLLAVIGPTGCQYLDKNQQQKYIRNGWNITGDLYYKDEDDYYYFYARADDAIISSGYNIAPTEIENIILEYPNIEDCIVVGVLDSMKGHLIKAYVKLKNCENLSNLPENESDALISNIKNHVKSKLAIYKCPHQIEFTDSIPRNLVGKVQKYKLR